MNKSSPQYAPRQGSKIAEAIEALRLRPMTARELADILQRDCSAINTLLLRALTHAAIIRVKDQRGRLHFALPDAELNGQFKIALKEDANMGSAESSAALARSDMQQYSSCDAGGDTRCYSEEIHLTDQMNHQQMNDQPPPISSTSPTSATTSNSVPVIAGLFADGELTISIGGECLQLNTTQRQQLYAYLHKIRYLE